MFFVRLDDLESKKTKAEESDFDPSNMTEEEDASIPEDEDASFVSFKGSKGKRGRGGYTHHYARVPSRPYAAVQNYESEDDLGYGRLPRQRYIKTFNSFRSLARWCLIALIEKQLL